MIISQSGFTSVTFTIDSFYKARVSVGQCFAGRSHLEALKSRCSVEFLSSAGVVTTLVSTQILRQGVVVYLPFRL